MLQLFNWRIPYMKDYLFDKIELDEKGIKFVAFRKPRFDEDFWGALHQIIAKNEKYEYYPDNFDDFIYVLYKTKFNHIKDEYDIIDLLNDQHLTLTYLVRRFANQLYDAGQRPTKEELMKFYRDAFEIRYNEQETRALLDKDPIEFIEQ